MATTNHPAGMYQVVSAVNIRKTPEIIDRRDANNRAGVLNVGDQRRVYETQTDKQGQTWGRISEYDAAGKALWICIVGLNRAYAVCTEPDTVPYNPLENRIDKLESWARSKGYAG